MFLKLEVKVKCDEILIILVSDFLILLEFKILEIFKSE